MYHTFLTIIQIVLAMRNLAHTYPAQLGNVEAPLQDFHFGKLEAYEVDQLRRDSPLLELIVCVLKKLDLNQRNLGTNYRWEFYNQSLVPVEVRQQQRAYQEEKQMNNLSTFSLRPRLFSATPSSFYPPLQNSA